MACVSDTGIIYIQCVLLTDGDACSFVVAVLQGGRVFFFSIE